jgi:hypothetical protein
MSYEGRLQLICANGHRYETQDVYDTDGEPCHCGARSIWSNSIDDTNCEAVGEIPEDAWKTFLLTPEVEETCNLGHTHVIREATYRVPTKEERAAVRCRWEGETCTYIPLMIEQILES